MIKENKLLIDKHCPMCQIYGQAFIKTGLLDQDSICAYQDVPMESQMKIDFERAQDEIAMHDTRTGTTTYGLASILKIITQSSPVLNKILHHALVYKVLNVLYKFISYNRKVIAPAAPPQGTARLCEPSFNIPFRWAYILFVAIVTALIVNTFTANLFPHFGWTHSIKTELLICIGQVAWQGTVAYFLLEENRLTYLGNMSTVSMIGAILLLPILFILSMVKAPLLVLLGMFFTVIGIMFLEHIRRCKLLRISLWMTVSWVTFRTVALGILILIKEIQMVW